MPITKKDILEALKHCSDDTVIRVANTKINVPMSSIGFPELTFSPFFEADAIVGSRDLLS